MRKPSALPVAAIEVMLLCAGVTVASLCFVVGWVTPNQAVVLTTLFLVLLLGLSWKNFNQGRHPCFLFLGMLLLLQGGRLRIAWAVRMTRCAFECRSTFPSI
jgi:hypothetical protein